MSKTYNATNAATLTSGNYTLTGVVNGDTVNLNDPTSGTYASVNVGTGINVTVTGLAISGSGAGNYVLGSTTATGAIGTITAAPLTITASAQSKTYGTTLSLGTTAFTTSTLYGSDTVTGVTLTSPGAAATATVAGSPYTITPSAATGSGLSNYTITYATGNLTVNPATLTAINGNRE